MGNIIKAFLFLAGIGVVIILATILASAYTDIKYAFGIVSIPPYNFMLSLGAIVIVFLALWGLIK